MSKSDNFIGFSYNLGFSHSKYSKTGMVVLTLTFLTCVTVF